MHKLAVKACRPVRPQSGWVGGQLRTPDTRGGPVRTVGADPAAANGQVDEPTLAYMWYSVAGRPFTDKLLEWPADMFALTNVILARSEAFRFALAYVGDWPPGRYADWGRDVEEAGRLWSAWGQDRRGAIPDLVRQEWGVIRERADMPLERLATGGDWRLCEALLFLHAVADEACAGLGIALDTSDGNACIYRARGRELLGRTGSLATAP